MLLKKGATGLPQVLQIPGHGLLIPGYATLGVNPPAVAMARASSSVFTALPAQYLHAPWPLWTPAKRGAIGWSHVVQVPGHGLCIPGYATLGVKPPAIAIARASSSVFFARPPQYLHAPWPC